ncbi:MAG: copper-containing nitrite reductase, partial [Lysobacter sp.]
MKDLVLLFALASAAGFTPMALAYQHHAAVTPVADVTFTLKTQIHEGQLVFVGDAGAIKGQISPELKVPEGAVVAITVINGDGAMHDVAVPEFGAQSDQLVGEGSATTIVFRATKA